VLKKIEKARRIFVDKTIAADGGVSLENLQSFVDIGVDYVCVGSRIFLNSSPGENYNQFIKKIAELEAIKSGKISGEK
jgi:pentose-5-phosphate-3-epimerase